MEELKKSDPFEDIEKMHEESVGTKVKRELFDMIKIFILCAVTVLVVTKFLVKPVQVDGRSMYPTLEDNEIGFTNVFSARFLEINRYDVVIVYNEDTEEYWVKRVIGLPGDRIFAKDGKVFINGVELEEPYLDTEYVKDNSVNHPFTEDFKEVKLLEDEYFLMGDNRIVSHDSRKVGPFQRDAIIGKGMLVLYPFDKIKWVE